MKNGSKISILFFLIIFKSCKVLKNGNKMKKMGFICIIAILIAGMYFYPHLTSSTDQSYNDEWRKVYHGKGISILFDIAGSSEGYLAVGATKETSEEWDGWLLKIDKNGNKLWEKFYGGEEEDLFSRVLQTDDDGYILAGYTRQRNNGDFWLLKIDKNGNKLWEKFYGGEEEDLLWDLIKVDGGYIAVGYKTLHISGEYITKAWLIKMDENGNEVWNKTYGNGETVAQAIVETEDGCVVSGIVSENFSYAWLIKIDKEGNEVWNKTYGWGMEYSAYLIRDGRYFVIGGETETAMWGDAYLIKIDENGNEIWKRRYGGYDQETIWDISKDKDGYLLAGFTYTFNMGGSQAANGWLIKVAKNGEEIWNKSFGESAGSELWRIKEINGKYLLVGDTSLQTDPLTDVGMIINCRDYQPPNIKITRPTKAVYIFDRKIFPSSVTIILGGITIVANISNLDAIDKVEFYLCGPFHYDNFYEPQATIYYPPYMWKWESFAIGAGSRPYIVTAAAYYGNAGAVAVDKIEVYIINPFPAPASSASLHK